MTPGRPGEPPPDIEETDPGAARARTELAWTRSVISFAALGAVIVKFRPALGVPIIAFSMVVWFVGRLPRDASGTAARRVLLVAAAVTALALTALVCTLLGQDSPGLRP